MNHNTASILPIIFAIIVFLGVLGAFGPPAGGPKTENLSSEPTLTATLKPSPAPTKKTMPKFTLFPIRTPMRTPITLRRNPSPSQSQPSQTSQTPPLSLFENFEPSAVEQSFTVLDQFGIPFGGRVTSIEGCDSFICGGASEMITVDPPRPGTFAINSGTTFYEFYDLSVGNWVLGLADGFDVCYIYDYFSGTCIPVNAGPAVKIMGTSQ